MDSNDLDKCQNQEKIKMYEDRISELEQKSKSDHLKFQAFQKNTSEIQENHRKEITELKKCLLKFNAFLS